MPPAGFEPTISAGERRALYIFISHMISPTDLLYPSSAPHFKTFQEKKYILSKISITFLCSPFAGVRFIRNIESNLCTAHSFI